MAEVDYEESGNTFTDLNRLRLTSDGYLDEVHQIRDDFDADLVVLLVSEEELEDEYNACGEAYVNPPASLGFSVVRYDCIENYTFSHEIGHNMGARHDTASVNINNSPYLYGHGYEFFDPVTLTRTMMATPFTSRVNYWSNPNVNYDGSGPAMGSAQYEDVAVFGMNVHLWLRTSELLSLQKQ